MLKLIFKQLSRDKFSITLIVISIVIYTITILNFSKIEDKLHSIILEKNFESIDAFSTSVLNVIAKNISEEELTPEGFNPKRYTFFTDILETLNFGSVKYIFIAKKENDRYFVVLDASKTERMPPFTPIQFLPEEEKLINEVINQKATRLNSHQDIDTIGITLYKPFLKDKELLGVLIIDFSLKKLREISSMLEVIKKSIIFLITVSIVSLNIIIISTFLAVYNRKRSIIDNLTGVYNRNFLEELQGIIDLHNYTVALIDIDFFKKINDTYGHDVGDKVLKEFANLLQKSIRKEDIIIRYGGEEFLLLFKKGRDSSVETINALERIRESVQELTIFITDKDYLKITVSTGMNLSTDKMRDLDEAIKKADIALYKAKARGRNRIEVYDETTQNKENVLKVSQIKQALEENRVLCLYQPIVDIKSGQTKHFEALARIIAPDGSFITPYQFINVIENTFLYTQLTKEVIEYNLKMLERYQNIKISINLKPADILNQSTIDCLLNIADGNVRRRLMLEIVETEDILTYERVLEVVERLREKGFLICVDDFGSGYSNFVYLLKLKVDYLKIDANLIRNIHNDVVSREVVKMINDFCKKMRIKVVAEFVENEHILETLKTIGIEYGQGYYFSKPDYLEKFLI